MTQLYKLEELPQQHGRMNIKIIDQSAVKFVEIGKRLLGSDVTGAIAEVTKGTPKNQAKNAIRLIYKIWIRRDKDPSWKNLIQCFRDVGLDPLAGDIEQYFGHCSPSGKCICLVSSHSCFIYSTESSQGEKEENISGIYTSVCHGRVGMPLYSCRVFHWLFYYHLCLHYHCRHFW